MYDNGLAEVQISASVLNELLRGQDAKLSQHLQQLDVDPMMFCIDWFMCAFIKVCPHYRNTVGDRALDSAVGERAPRLGYVSIRGQEGMRSSSRIHY